MRIANRLLWGLLIVALLASELVSNASAQPPSQFFPETNYTISGEFLDFYRSISDPFQVLGYPISGEMEDPVTHYTVQYFQLGRLELHPEEPAGQRVMMSDLGTYVYTPGAVPSANVPTWGPNCRYFQATGKTVCEAFLAFYDRFGAKYFGNPISQVEYVDGRYTQYFEKVAMEWRPEVPDGRHVGLADLGTRYYALIDRSTPEPVGWIADAHPARIQVHAFTQDALVESNSQQTLYVVVQNEKLQPVPNAAVSVTVTLPNNRQEKYRPPVTNQDGISVFSFNIGDVDVKQIVNVDVIATINGMEKTTSTWFRVWW